MDKQQYLTSFHQDSADGMFLQSLMEEGHTRNKTAGQIQKLYPVFGKYNNKIFGAAYGRAREKLKRGALYRNKLSGGGGESKFVKLFYFLFF